MAIEQDRAIQPVAQPHLDGFEPPFAALGLAIVQLCFGQPGEEPLLPFAARFDIGLDLRALQPLQSLGQPAIAARRMVRAGRREQVMRGEDEILLDPIARLQLRRHQAGDVEHDFLVVDRRDAARRRAHLDRDGRVIIGKRLHPGVFRQCEERERHQRAFAADLAMQRAVEREQIALGDAVSTMGRTIRSRGTGHGHFLLESTKIWTPMPFSRGEMGASLQQFVLSSRKWGPVRVDPFPPRYVDTPTCRKTAIDGTGRPLAIL